MSIRTEFWSTLNEVIDQDYEQLLQSDEVEPNFVEDRLKEFNKYFEIKTGSKYITIKPKHSYTMHYLLKSFLEIDETKEIPFEVKRGIRDSLKIDLSRYFNKYSTDIYNLEKRNFFLQFLQVLYMESWR